jgi:hypothetical protein
MGKVPRQPEAKRQKQNKTKRKRPPQIGKLGDDLLNQLSVIQLSCFSLRKRLEAQSAVTLREFDRIEKAVDEAADLTQRLCARIANSRTDDSDQGGESSTPLLLNASKSRSPLAAALPKRK